jgi:hypothetical protein
VKKNKVSSPALKCTLSPFEMLEATTYPQQKSFLYKTLTTSLLELAAMEKSWKEFLKHPRKIC